MCAPGTGPGSGRTAPGARPRPAPRTQPRAPRPTPRSVRPPSSPRRLAVRTRTACGGPGAARPPARPPGAAAPREPSHPPARGSPSPTARPRAPHLGTPRQARRARRPTPCPAGRRRRRNAAPHSRTGSGRRDRKWRGGDSAALARGGRDCRGRFKKKIQSPEELYLEPDRRTAECAGRGWARRPASRASLIG